MTALRQIILDTETTGFEPSQGHKIVEIGCLEIINYLPTGVVYHTYLNPERDVPADATAVHGLTEDFLKGHPKFQDIHVDFLDFIGDDQLIIHNAPFDMKFLNAELKTVGKTHLSMNRVIDTLAIARKKFPGSPASLDALCKRFNVDNSKRDKHGALLDSELLAEIYLELVGGRQPGFTFQSVNSSDNVQTSPLGKSTSEKPHREPRQLYATTEEERQAHRVFMSEIHQKTRTRQSL